MIKKAIVVGNGNIAARHRKNLKLLLPDVFIIAVPTRGNLSTQKIDNANEVILDLNEAINNKADIAIVASPSTFHKKHAVELMLAGVPSLIEKPIASNILDAKQMIKTQLQTGTPICAGYSLRYMPSSIQIKKLLEKKIIGNVYNAFVNVGQFLPNWRPKKNYKETVSAKKILGGGVLLELSHEIDYIQWLLGSMKVDYAQLRNSSELKLEVEELADFVLVSEKGTVCNIHLDFLQKKAHRTCTFIGEKGNLEWDLIKNKIQLLTEEANVCLFADEDWDSNQMYINLLKDFLKLAKGTKNSTINLEQAIKTIELINKVSECAVQGVTQ